MPLIVLGSPNQRKMIGIALEVGVTDNWSALWALRVNGADVPGYFVIVDGRFEPVPIEPALPGRPPLCRTAATDDSTRRVAAQTDPPCESLVLS